MTKQHVQSYGSRTDVGLVRPHNEDSLIAKPPLFAVADGMGGHEAGEVASEIAIQTLVAQAPAQPDPTGLQKAVIAANKAVIHAALTGVGRPGMGTTMTAAMLSGTRLVIAQVGDSRAYLLHDGVLQPITRDHSLVAELVSRGEITEEEARWHPQRSVITRALGADDNTVPDIYDLPVSVGDRLLLCSDGLSGMLYDDQMETILIENSDPQRACDVLIDAANNAGGHDNITAIAVDVTDDETAQGSGKKAHRAKMGLAVFVIALVAVLLCSVLGIYLYANNSAYVIAENGQVVVYRGLIGEVAGIKLSWLDHKTDISVDDLPMSTALRLQDGVQVSSVSAADALIDDYEQEAKDNASTTSSLSSSTSSKTSSTSSSTKSSTSSSTSSGTKSTTSSTAGSSSSSTQTTTGTKS